MRKKIALHNLGCKVNAYELDQVAASLRAEGYEIVPFSDTADVYVVNTCTVTNIADRKSRQMLHRAKKKNPDALVVALGCYVDTDQGGVKKDAAIDLALPNRDKGRLAEVLRTYFATSGGPPQESGKSDTPKVSIPCVAHAPYVSRTRAFVKIQDGCNLGCTYCIIPAARGKSISRDAEEILNEVRHLAQEGISEVVLTGIHISSYGLDNGAQIRLGTLVQKINAVDGIARIRLGSLEPATVTREFVAQIRGADKLCPHFHLSLQSGSDAVLRRMKRRYTTAAYRDSICRLRDAFDTPAITTDIITGFPAETDKEFEETLHFAEEMEFYEMHVFPFSARKGTAACQMDGQLTQAEKAARSRRLIALSKRQARAYRGLFSGQEVLVLWEEEEEIAGKRCFTGYTTRYVRVAVPAEQASSGQISKVTPASFLTEEVLFADSAGT